MSAAVDLPAAPPIAARRSDGARAQPASAPAAAGAVRDAAPAAATVAAASATAAATPSTATPADVAATAAAAASAAALQLYGHLLGARSLDEAAHRLAAELARLLNAQRVSVGLRQRGRTRLVAVTNLDERRASAELPTLIIGAMDEAIDQALPVLEPAPPGAPDGIRLAHSRLRRAAGSGSSLLTVPLGQDGQPLGAVCIERHGPAPFGLRHAAQAGPLLALAVPLLALLGRAEEAWWRRSARRAAEALRDWRKPERRTARLLLAASAALLLALAAWPLPQPVAGRARIEGAQQRVLAAPTDGFIAVAHARPGDRVARGAPLIELMAQDLELERQRWASQLAQHENAHAAALAKADRGQAALAITRVAEAQAQLALLEGQLGRSRLTAPFDGVVIEGDFSRSVGAPVRQGDALLTLAEDGRYRVVVDIDETEIARVQPGQAGRLRLSGGDWSGLAVQVDRVAALARVVEGRNVFEVEARLTEAATGLRPGLLGRAEIVVGHRPPLWHWAGRAADRMRLAWWHWLG